MTPTLVVFLKLLRRNFPTFINILLLHFNQVTNIFKEALIMISVEKMTINWIGVTIWWNLIFIPA